MPETGVDRRKLMRKGVRLGVVQACQIPLLVDENYVSKDLPKPGVGNSGLPTGPTRWLRQRTSVGYNPLYEFHQQSPVPGD